MTPAQAPQATTAPAEEHTFFEQGPVKVTQTQLIVPGQAYALSLVKSARFTEIAPSRCVPTVLSILGVVFLVEVRSLGRLGIGLAVVLLSVGISWYHSLKSHLAVTLRTAYTEVQAVKDEDANHIHCMVRALNEAEAIVFRRDLVKANTARASIGMRG